MLSIKINKILEQQDRTMYWLSKQTGISPNQINKICNGETTRVDFDTIEKICKSLDCSINDIFESTDPQMKRLLTYYEKFNNYQGDTQ